MFAKRNFSFNLPDKEPAARKTARRAVVNSKSKANHAKKRLS